MVGWATAEDLPRNPNAHFSRNKGTWSRVNPAIGCRLKPAVAKIRPPAIPLRPIEPLGKPDRILRALRNVGRGSLRDRGNGLLRVSSERQSRYADNYCNAVSPAHRSVPLLVITTA